MSTDKCPKASPPDSALWEPPRAWHLRVPRHPASFPTLPRGPRVSASQALRLTPRYRHPFFFFFGGRWAVLGYGLSEPQCSGGSSIPGSPHGMPVINGVW